ncbi:cytoplasmic polyadenylation element-binding protein 1-A isoform X1 [Danaus plexippus]|uniref:cytoplasmic polyadenylation element-binding protein 1-A isoform X1 n=1 Tax=Danaus plexippus TaxID=13037 RepID=UPI002AB18547|nr:cytoplasmic polyadenylation element-binding protein 1-A isoform X1 [Danaus plexippus]
MAMPPTATRSKSFHLKRLSCDALETVESPWPPEGAHAQPQEESRIARRASFCGVVSNVRTEGSVRWHGALPARGGGSDAGYSPKLFLGGLPYDITEQALMHALRHFQPVRVEWPGRGAGAARGCAYVTLEGERRVRALLAACRRDGPDWYYRLATRNMRTKEVQVIPWAVSDSNWVCAGGAAGSVRLEPARTVFVGALHGMLSAAGLATIMNDLFSGVIYAGIDTDKNKYPIGSGRVTFNNVRSYVRAISAAYVEICTDKFTKKVQVDPYLEDSMCSVCNLQQGPYFCREPVCFRYFCRSCWAAAHAAEQHKPLMRNCKSATLPTALSHHSPASSTHLSGARAADGGFNGFGNVSNDAAPSPATSGSGSACAEDAPHDWMAR